MPLADEYLASLMTLSDALEAYRRLAGNEAVLVGGAATTIYTGGLFPSGDFDIVAGNDEAFNTAMLSQGFEREEGYGRLLFGFYHPKHPTFGFQQVSGRLFDGRSDDARLVRVAVTGTGAGVVLPSIEDMIADRLGQHAIAPPSDVSRLRQAEAMYRLAEAPDTEYLIRRILDEGGDPALLGLVRER